MHTYVYSSFTIEQPDITTLSHYCSVSMESHTTPPFKTNSTQCKLP